MKYLINFSTKDHTIDVPEGAVFKMDSVAAGENNSHITMLAIYDNEGQLAAAFVGVMGFWPLSFEPAVKTWAR